MIDSGNLVDFPDLSEYKVIAIDIEGDGVVWYRNTMCGFSVSTDDFDIYHDIRKTPGALDWLYDEMKAYNGLIVNHNIKFDAHFLRNEGIDISRKNLQCTLVRAMLIDETMYPDQYDLDTLGFKYLNERKEQPYAELAAIFGGKPTRKAQMGNIHKAPVDIVAPYARQDTALALKLWKWQNKEIEKQELQEINELENKVLPVLLRMEARGIRVDVEKAKENMEKLEKEIDVVQSEANKLAGKKINTNSTPQIREIFKPTLIEGTKQWRLIDGTIAPSTPLSIKNEGKINKRGKMGELSPSIGAETLKQMKHPLASKIIELRTVIKIHGTFLRDQILGFQENGIIYPNFHQIGTVNGRFAASKPALQAVPKRNKKMKELTRSVFLPDEDEELLRCDFEQSDFRGFVHYTKSKPLVKAYRKDPWTDFHQLVANTMDIPRDCPPDGGPYAKPINLGSIFGMGSGKLAKTMGLPYTERVSSRGKVWLEPGPEAEELFERYHIRIPGVKDFNKSASSVARTRGYVISICGRHLRFPNKGLVYKAPGYLYSSFTSDLCKSAMVVVDSLAKIKLQVHDEIIFSIPDRSVIPDIQEAMQTALGNKTDIPIRTNPEVGLNWHDCKPLKG